MFFKTMLNGISVQEYYIIAGIEKEACSKHAECVYAHGHEDVTNTEVILENEYMSMKFVNNSLSEFGYKDKAKGHTEAIYESLVELKQGG